MQPEFQGIRLLGNEQFDWDIRDLEVIESEHGTVLVAVNGVNGGITSYDVLGSNLLVIDSQLHQNATLLTGPISPAPSGGGFALGGTLGSTLRSYNIVSGGEISTQMQTGLPGDGAGLRSLDLVNLNGTEYAYAIDADGRLGGWRLAEGTDPIPVDLTGEYQHDRTGLVEAVPFSDTTILAVADSSVGGLSTYAIDPVSGALSARDRFGATEGLAISTPTMIMSFEANGSSWVILASAGNDTLSVFQVSEGGELDFRDQVQDTQLSRFQSVSAIDAIDVDGNLIVVAAGSDDGFTIMRLSPNGELFHQTTLEHELGNGLENVNALELHVEGGEVHVFASSQASAGIAQFTIGLDQIGGVQTATSGALNGGAGSDLLVGNNDAHGISGGGGDDLLIAQSAGDVLTGGGGNDQFVASAVNGQITITDFRSGVDRLSFSLFPTLRNSDQLGFVSTATGAVLTFSDTVIRVENALGAPLEREEIWWDGFDALDRMALGDVSSDGIIYGLGGDDLLSGTFADDHIQGQSGNDRLDGLGGDDRLSGGDGQDVLSGSAGSDTLLGGLGLDTLEGGDGDDSIFGEQGNDQISGDDGSDEIWAGDGDDFVRGGAGADQISGGNGHDELRGTGGNDVLLGGPGADLVKGNGGNDTLFGNEGMDTLRGGKGDDRLEGGASDDRLKGKIGNDTLLGGEGNDTLRGSDGDDHLYGETGNDRLVGDEGNDQYWGGEGADVFVFRGDHGTDRIQDYADGEDQIFLKLLGPGGIRRFHNLDITQQGTDVLIETGLGQIWLADTQLSAIDGGDFIF